MNFEEFLRETKEAVYWKLSTKISNKSDIDDLLQEIYLRFWKGKKNETIEISDKRLLWTIVKGEIARYYEKLNKNKTKINKLYQEKKKLIDIMELSTSDNVIINKQEIEEIKFYLIYKWFLTLNIDAKTLILLKILDIKSEKIKQILITPRKNTVNKRYSKYIEDLENKLSLFLESRGIINKGGKFRREKAVIKKLLKKTLIEYLYKDSNDDK